MLTYGSLFSGFAGLDEGLHRAGWQCRFQVEINAYAQRVLARHYPDVPRFSDVRDFRPGSDPRWQVDLLAFGDPCTGNSNAGNVHKAQHIDIGAEAIRIIDEIRPRLVLRENPSVERADAVRPWRKVRNDLESRGYVVLPFRIRACCVGAEHRRERLFLLASLPDADSERLEGLNRQRLAQGHVGGAAGSALWRARRDVLPPPRVCRGSDGVPGRVERIKGLGNAVDVRVAEWIGRRIIEAIQGAQA